VVEIDVAWPSRAPVYATSSGRIANSTRILRNAMEWTLMMPGQKKRRHLKKTSKRRHHAKL
jgi:hypothetical protein